MGDQTEHPDPDERPRRFRLARRVRQTLPETREARELRELDDADPGTPEQDRALRTGCGGCLNVSLLLFVIMIASIIGTCAIRK